MSAMLDKVIPLNLPKKPRIKLHESPPDQRKICVLPLTAVNDKNLTDGGLRVLAGLCSYCNRAGLTWVSQNTLAKSLGISRQSVTNQIAQLRKLGYVEVAKKSFRGIRPNTLRVIYDPTIDLATAIAITSAQEPTRPPHMEEKPDPEGQRKVAELIAKAFNQPPKKEPIMTKPGQSRTVQKMKEDIAKVKSRRSKPVDKPVDEQSSIGHPTVSNVESPIGHATVSSKDIVGCPETQKEHYISLGILGHESLKENGISYQQAREHLECIIEAYRIEGLTPNPDRLPAEILQLHRDTQR
jgi:biotin operon repressor